MLKRFVSMATAALLAIGAGGSALPASLVTHSTAHAVTVEDGSSDPHGEFVSSSSNTTGKSLSEEERALAKNLSYSIVTDICFTDGTSVVLPLDISVTKGEIYTDYTATLPGSLLISAIAEAGKTVEEYDHVAFSIAMSYPSGVGIKDNYIAHLPLSVITDVYLKNADRPIEGKGFGGAREEVVSEKLLVTTLTGKSNSNDLDDLDYMEISIGIDHDRAGVYDPATREDSSSGADNTSSKGDDASSGGNDTSSKPDSTSSRPDSGSPSKPSSSDSGSASEDRTRPDLPDRYTMGSMVSFGMTAYISFEDGTEQATDWKYGVSKDAKDPDKVVLHMSVTAEMLKEALAKAGKTEDDVRTILFGVSADFPKELELDETFGVEFKITEDTHIKTTHMEIKSLPGNSHPMSVMFGRRGDVIGIPLNGEKADDLMDLSATFTLDLKRVAVTSYWWDIEDPDADIRFGDVDGDETINVTDVTMLASHLKGFSTLNEEQQRRADMDKDGELTVTDITKLAAYVKGL